MSVKFSFVLVHEADLLTHLGALTNREAIRRPGRRLLPDKFNRPREHRDTVYTI